ncbi:PrsW family intramembrane metalloprotease [Jiangella aurantiaca]|uniref:PrsW family intramembrane metalloprotease n=1 Tax=Jiangella aurantiaca TaxID=2530373 RepID=A0A4V2YRZ5_9ACTN|nr:PrsW family glutamic-type intramembrane protease [Jiangella aurantiaca]TDD67497.1 PrsW family intramembrane metalloprotease [Jiangella aurantiaca]
MSTLTERLPVTHAPALRLRWLAVLLTGLALFGVVFAVVTETGDPVFLPCLLLVGAAVVPATFTTLVSEMETTHRLSTVRILTGAILGGVVGGVLAGQLEFETVRTFGSLPYAMIGLIEESAKLAIPVLLLAWLRPRARAVDGLVLGVAVGSGFAALETMGYGFVALISTGGQLDPVGHVLMLRALSSLGGHAAWTGLACAAFFGIRGARSRALGWLRFGAVFAGVIGLHAWWDQRAALGSGYAGIAVASFVLLTAVAVALRERPAR